MPKALIGIAALLSTLHLSVDYGFSTFSQQNQHPPIIQDRLSQEAVPPPLLSPLHQAPSKPGETRVGLQRRTFFKLLAGAVPGILIAGQTALASDKNRNVILLPRRHLASEDLQQLVRAL